MMPNNQTKGALVRRRSSRGTTAQIQALAAALYRTKDKTKTSPLATAESPSQSTLRHSKRRRMEQQQQEHSRNNRIVVLTGAGLSVNSGIRPFRGRDGLWSQTLWTNATRTSFRKDPLRWYNHFWLPHFPPPPSMLQDSDDNYYKPNEGHEAIAKMCNIFDNMCVITQNVDGLHTRTRARWNWEDRLVECHGRLGLFKCIPSWDSDTSEDETDSDCEDEDDKEKEKDGGSHRGYRYKRLVKLGSLRKRREWKRRYESSTAQGRRPQQYDTTANSQSDSNGDGDTGSCSISNNAPCRYEMDESIPMNLIESLDTRHILCGGSKYGNDGSDDVRTMQTEYSDVVTVQLSSSSGNNKTTPTMPKPEGNSGTIASDPTLSSTAIDTHISTPPQVPQATQPSCTVMNKDSTAVSITVSEEEGDTKEEDVSRVDPDESDEHVEERKYITRGQKRRQQQEKRRQKRKQRSKQSLLHQTKTPNYYYRPPPPPSPPPTQPKRLLTSPPKCPSCSRPIAPQALLFDEAYHSHSHYQFEKMEQWIAEAAILLFVGTSFAVNITDVALEHARKYGIPVWNFNLEGGDMVEGRGRLDAENVVGDVVVTLPALLSACCDVDNYNIG